ncbi:MAG: SOS response-associated peptidase [Acidimicrobiia bacterium]
MCGRVAVARPLDGLAEYFAARVVPALLESWEPSWNVAPTRPLVGLFETGGGERVLQAFTWGLRGRLFNARSETVTMSAAFRDAVRSRRLAVPVDGFYEWAGEGHRRRPRFFRRADGDPLVLAGLWERNPDGALTCTILTTASGPDVAAVHDREPVVLGADVLDRWLHHSPLRQSEVDALCRPSAAGTLTSHPVDRRVGDVRNDSPDLVQPVPDGADPPDPEPLTLFG